MRCAGSYVPVSDFSVREEEAWIAGRLVLRYACPHCNTLFDYDDVADEDQIPEHLEAW